MIKTAEIMTREVITLPPDMEISEAAKILLDNHINGAPVVDRQGNLLGILCQSDLIAQQKKLPIPSLFTFLDGFISLASTKQMEKEVRKIAAASVDQAMTGNPVTVTPDTGIEAVAGLMVDNSFHTLPVVSGGKLVGIVGKEDVLRTIITTGTPSR
jgi:CBS domain-containing protein